MAYVQGGTPSRASAKAGPPKEFLIPRDNERPFSFAGYQLAKASMDNALGIESVSAAIYETVGGKFITHLSKDSPLSTVIGAMATIPLSHYYDETGAAAKKKQVQRDGYSKAAVFETLGEALEWFRPGRLTDAIRKQLGVDDPIRID